MDLEELFTPTTEGDLSQIVDSEMLIKLARDDKCEVGLELPQLDKYYISRSFNRNGQNISEEDLWRSTEVDEEKVVLISDSAGMGKSCVLTSLAISIKRDNPHLWVVRFDLNNYTSVMETALEEGRKSVSIVEMLNSQENWRLESEFDKKLFATPKRVVLMLDGVDEVSPTYTELVVNLIRDSVAQVNVAKIFVTFRPHMSKDFEEMPELQCFTFEPFSKNHQEEVPDLKSFTLEPFSKVNQIDFLVKYWTETMDDVRKSKCNIYAEALIENVSLWLNEEDRNSFAGIPLQTRMLAEIFQEENEIGDDWEGCKEFLSSNNEQPKMPTRFDITQLYKLFVDKKCDIFIKKSNPSRSIAADQALQHELEKCQKFHRALALKVIFESGKRLQFFACYKNVKFPIPTTFANDYLLKVGIVQRQGGNVKFIHRTFAEYFVAECLLIELDRKPVNEAFQRFFMSSVMMDKEFYVIRAFLNSHVPNVLRSLENNFCSYFSRNRISDWSLSRYFTILAEGGCAKILDCLIKCIDREQREILSATVSNALMHNALYFAIRYGHLTILKLLLELNETFNKGKDAHKEFLQKAITDTIKFNLEAFKFLLCQVDTRGKNILGRSAVHEAAFMDRLDEVESLVKAGADVNIRDNVLGWTAVYEAIFMGRLEVAKFLVDKAEADINIKANDGETALHKTAYWNRLEVAKFLVEKTGADINIKDDKGWTVLHKTAYWGRLEAVKFLVEETGADINIKDNNGETALHKTAYWSRLEVAKFLVEGAGADINAKDNDGETTLHKAAYWDEFEMVKFLVEETGADINIKDDKGWTALHTAAARDRLETVKCLVDEAGADVNVENNQGKTALRVAADRGHWKMVRFLSNSNRWVVFKMRTGHFFRANFMC